MERSHDWIKQAEFDFETAETLVQHEKYAWVCFISHQVAEKALNAFLESLNKPGWGHDLTDLIIKLQDSIDIPEELVNACARLNLYYIPTRYPDAFSSGSPSEKFTRSQSNQAIKDAKEVLNYVKSEIETR